MFASLDNLSTNTISLLALIIPIIIALVPVVFKGIAKRKAFLLWRQKEMDNKFNPQFDDNEQTVLKLITSRFFIPIHGQKNAPHNEIKADEVEQVDLVKKLVDDILKGKGKMRFIVLGGSGMGKSTFSAALFHTYIYRFKFKKPPYPIFVQYLGDERSIEVIEQIKDDNRGIIASSILLLDAFDENREAALNRQDFWNTINRITHDFKVVIITCRPQFFDNEASEPTESSIWVNSPNGLMSYKKYYISPFSDDDIQRYLEAKYRIESEDYRKAKLISDKCKDLAIRPMVLAFIDELKDYRGYTAPNIAEIYYQIIDSWITRECRHLPKNEQKERKAHLFSFSKELAYRIFDVWKADGRLYLTADEFERFVTENGDQISPYSYKERSLVNRTSEGNIKFAHKSFLEFFVAVLSLERPGIMINPQHWDIARVFYNALYELFIKGEEYGFINYYKPDYFKTSGFSNVDFSLPIKLHDWWKFHIQNAPAVFSICRESENVGFIQMMGLDLDSIQRVHVVQKGIEMTIGAVQIMQKSDNSSFIYLDVSDDIVDTVSKHLKEISLSFLPSGLRLKETLLMPNLFEFNQEIIDASLGSIYMNLVSVGCGINQPDTVYYCISRLSKAGICPDFINVYREGDDLNEHVDFIVGLQSIEFKPRYIMISISYKYEQLLFFYNDDIIGEMDKNTVLSILLNQIDDGKPHPESNIEMMMMTVSRDSSA